MPKPRAAKLETATARRRLGVRKKPYWTTISPGVGLGYRRCAGPGTWSVRSTDGHGSDWIKRIALADDFEPSDGRAVLNYWQAIDEARKLARRQPGDDADESRPLTVAEAIDLYARDLAARGGDDYNAKRSRIHLPGSILSKPVGLLRATELCKWRDGLIEKGLARDTVNRIRTCVRAALTLAAKRDKRITNRHIWEDDLEALPNATMARNVVLADDVVGKLVTTAYARDRNLGLLCDVVSTTGARPSQAVRLLVADLDLADRSAPQLLMPRSGKGHANKRAAKMAERVRVQITPELAALLKQEAKGRAGDASLLMRSNGEPWGYRRSDQYRQDFAEVVTDAGLDPKTVTLYALRHSYISRALLRGISITLVADATDTSEKEIRRHYAKLISDHSGEIMRRALLDVSQPSAANVVALKG